ncbi:hypothetical protein XI09_02515 [Bradyrhizobium sp. CCBAU 11386]|nr:hypothetical protein [Bradyrhizobium sp. CCBAU 11386]
MLFGEDHTRSASRRTRLLQQSSAALVADLFDFLQQTLRRISGNPKLAEPIRYGVSRVAIFERFLTDGRIELDCSIVERATATKITGKLFAGSGGGGQTWATIATLPQTAKVDDVDPFAWLAVLPTVYRG